MSEIQVPGYELANLPTDSPKISHDWLTQFNQQSALAQIQVQSLIDRALIQQQILKKVIANC
ncbi:MAG: hypothetical protein AAF298_24435 [Cyanobacteria bacterium P01_A01_bin.40]